MESTPASAVLLHKTRDLCAAIAESPEFVSIRERLERFSADPVARGQYEALNQTGAQLQEKQQLGLELPAAEIAQFEATRDAFLSNVVAKDFLAAREEMFAVQESVANYVSKTFELGRVPKISEMAASCGPDCGCH